VSPWVELIAREVEFAESERVQTYHALGQRDYVVIVAVTPDGHIPIVRQYRPAIEAFTLELPAGFIDADEHPAETCRRELLEETGFPVRAVHLLGIAAPCTARLSNRMHSFFVKTGERSPTFKPEAGISVELVSTSQLARLIVTGEFINQTHIGTIMLAELKTYLKLKVD